MEELPIKLYTNNTTVEDILKFIDWGLRFSDIVQPLEKVGKRKDFPAEISPIEQFENELAGSYPQKRKELIYAGLRYYKRIIKTRLNISIPIENNEYYYYELQLYKTALFKNEIFKHYNNGDNPKLLILKDMIIAEVEAEFTNFHNNNPPYGPEDFNQFENSPLINVANYIFNSCIKQSIESVITPMDFIKYLEDKLRELDKVLNEIEITTPQLIWNGTPSQFGYIIDLLIQGGYIERPTSSFSKDAEFYLKFFSIITTSSTLTKELSEKTNSMIPKNRISFKIPPKDKLL